ncbi:putative transcriptional regulator [Methylobacter tundripaludum]|jgi:putative transcriptional regulator|uniref:Putative transcriptional regulator n=1 Tax=Methylobacter tundripaludum TaxID=173365 RepID=A0A2S6H562_9GAMM|nr:helix-turn-helix transcriptional regulator [Methylobacter tundripaludum]PPK72526.1 putative transcriptional regulator [Methylobacter tundripaludum]
MLIKTKKTFESLKMLRFKIKELIEKKEFSENRRITINELADSTGINRMTLSKIINHRGYSTVTDNLDKLCTYFECNIEELVEHIPDDKLKQLEEQRIAK